MFERQWQVLSTSFKKINKCSKLLLWAKHVSQKKYLHRTSRLDNFALVPCLSIVLALALSVS